MKSSKKIKKMPTTSFRQTEKDQAAVRIAAGFPKDTQKVPVDLSKGKSDELKKAEFDTAERKKLAKEKEARPDGSFPIRQLSDLKNAIHDVGRSNNPAAAKAWIKKRAKDLDLESELPDSWKRNVSKTEKDEINKLEQWEQNLEKGGEGSKGGKVIGHTKSGKPIYDNANHKGHSAFTSKEHKEAAKLHNELYEDANIDGVPAAMRKHYKEEARHLDMAKTGSNKSDKRYVNPEAFHGDERTISRQEKKAEKFLDDKKGGGEHEKTEREHVDKEIEKVEKKHKEEKKIKKSQSDELEQFFSNIINVDTTPQTDLVEKAFQDVLGVKTKENPIDKAFEDVLSKGGPGSGKKSNQGYTIHPKGTPVKVKLDDGEKEGTYHGVNYGGGRGERQTESHTVKINGEYKDVHGSRISPIKKSIVEKAFDSIICSPEDNVHDSIIKGGVGSGKHPGSWEHHLQENLGEGDSVKLHSGETKKYMEMASKGYALLTHKKDRAYHQLSDIKSHRQVSTGKTFKHTDFKN